MVEVILVSHGSYAKAMLESSELIVGEQENVTTFGFKLGENVDDLKDSIEEKIKEIKAKTPEAEILVLTDMKSGSPFNATARLMQHYDFEHIAGINFPLFLEVLATRDEATAKELKESIMELKDDTIVDVNELMEE